MILVLDDNPIRHRMFKKGLIGAPVVHTTRADEAVRLLQEHRPSVVFLDFDLDQFGDLTAGNGRQVVNWILTAPDDWRKTTFFIHSMNPIDGPGMYRALIKAKLKAHLYPRAWELPTLMGLAVAYAKAA